MSTVVRHWWIVSLLCGVAFVVSASAAEKAKPKTPADKPAAKEAAAKEAAAEPAPKSDPFAVPDGTPEELLKYIEGLRKPPAELTPETAEQYYKKASQAMVKACDKILAAKPNDEQAMTAARMMRSGLAMLDQMGDKEAGKRLEGLPVELQKAGWPKLVREARGFLLQRQFRSVSPESAEQVEKLIGEVKKYLAEGPIEPSDVRLMMNTGQLAEMAGEMGGKKDLAAETYRAFAKMLAESKDEKIAGLAKMMEGVVRRLTLVGNTIKVEGTILGAGAFDWSKYAGKVVLVDFWATWCPPCVAEVPNMKKIYELYHGRGFEIVGISCDRSREQLEAFIKKNEIPWTILYSDENPSPSLEHYGIMGIPTMVLVGADGKVVSTRARGPQLRQELEKLLGKVEEKPSEKPKEPEKVKDSAK